MAKDRKFNRYIQRLLNARGSYGLEVDGDVGDLTRSAILDFQKRMGLKETGTVNMATLEALRAPVIPPIPRPRPARSDIAGTAPIAPVESQPLPPIAPMSLAPQASMESGMGMSATGAVLPPPLNVQGSMGSGAGMLGEADMMPRNTSPDVPASALYPGQLPQPSLEERRARFLQDHARSMMEANMNRAGHSRELEARRMFEEQNGLGVPFGPSSTTLGAGAGNIPLSLGGLPPPMAGPGPNFSAANDQPQIPDALMQMLQARIAERNAPQPAMTPDMLKQELMRQIFSMRVGAQ